uniref:Uncharacterized protein n=1 Tax=Rhizophora mucronata TaxID=61149 RepID=A0A2P2P987_RHIMU
MQLRMVLVDLVLTSSGVASLMAKGSLILLQAMLCVPE